MDWCVIIMFKLCVFGLFTNEPKGKSWKENSWYKTNINQEIIVYGNKKS